MEPQTLFVQATSDPKLTVLLKYRKTVQAARDKVAFPLVILKMTQSFHLST